MSSTSTYCIFSTPKHFTFTVSRCASCVLCGSVHLRGDFVGFSISSSRSDCQRRSLSLSFRGRRVVCGRPLGSGLGSARAKVPRLPMSPRMPNTRNKLSHFISRSRCRVITSSTQTAERYAWNQTFYGLAPRRSATICMLMRETAVNIVYHCQQFMFADRPDSAAN